MSKMKKTLAAVLACAMAVSTSMVAFAGDYGQGDVTVDSPAGVKSPIIKVSIPTDMDTYINPFGAGEPDGISSQITTAEQLIINKSSVPVKVTIKGSVEAVSGVTVKQKPSQVVIDDAGNSNKELYVEAVALPGTWATTGATGATALTPVFTIDGDVEYSAATGANVESKAAIPAGTSATKEIMTFALKQATDGAHPNDFQTADSVDTTNGVAAYRLMGTVNPAAQWKGKDTTPDVQIHLIYSISGLPGDMYTSLYGNSAEYNPTGKVTNMVNTHIEKLAVKSGSNPTKVLTFTAGDDGAYVAPANLTVESLKTNITISSIKEVKILDGGVETAEGVPAGNGMTYVASTKGLNVLPTWTSLPTAALKEKNEVKVKITFNVVDANNAVAEGADPLTEYIVVTLKKAAPVTP